MKDYSKSIDAINLFFEKLANNNMVPETAPLEEQVVYLDPDDDFDFHAYRILLLIRICGIIKKPFFTNYTIYGRKKFSFFDFLIRYPFYLQKVIEKSEKHHLLNVINIRPYETEKVFSPMIKYIRGPSDPRYDSIFNYMICKNLIEVKFANYSTSQKAFCISLTSLGLEVSEQLRDIEEEWATRMEIIKSVFADNTTENFMEKYVIKYFPELILGNWR
ncbi:hypothetical protein [Paenibacillus odorifer]|uniref:hypothetical protein n=1 Tax=Paenibacillus odorifer TaxID=189426 RepID=UPI000BA16E74|nr:hypothetical protein [Paenibacillus odorifer]OZQ64379.1 hypothetical protein CA596_28980 [Paenibacillus odorifer]